MNHLSLSTHQLIRSATLLVHHHSASVQIIHQHLEVSAHSMHRLLHRHSAWAQPQHPLRQHSALSDRHSHKHRSALELRRVSLLWALACRRQRQRRISVHSGKQTLSSRRYLVAQLALSVEQAHSVRQINFKVPSNNNSSNR